MIPVERVGTRPPSLETLQNESGQLIALSLLDTSETIRFDDDVVTVARMEDAAELVDVLSEHESAERR